MSNDRQPVPVAKVRRLALRRFLNLLADRDRAHDDPGQPAPPADAALARAWSEYVRCGGTLAELYRGTPIASAVDRSRAGARRLTRTAS